MFLLHRPDRHIIDRFLCESAELPLSYSPIGLVHGATHPYDVDVTEVVVGHGQTDFDRARGALLSWTQFKIGWVELFPQAAPVEPGTVVAVLANHFGFWSLSGCRVVYVLDGDDTRCGFAYGTLTNHVESGEELFELEFDRGTGGVTYRIRAASRPRAVIARLGYPIARSLQARFRRDSAEAMRRCTIADRGIS